MTFAAHGTVCPNDGASMTALSPFSLFTKLQHTCDMRYRPAVDQCRRRLLASQGLSAPVRKRQKVEAHAFDPSHCTRHATTICRAQAAFADPAVTGQPQQEATPNIDAKQSIPKKSSAYPFDQLEAKWQDYWLRRKTFRTPGINEIDKSKPKFYALDMFPYPRFELIHLATY